MAYLLLLVSAATYTFVVYLHPYLNLWYEIYKTERTFELEQKELRLQSQKYDLMRKYPEMYNEQNNTVVEGFRYDAPEEYYEECYDDDDEDVEDNGKYEIQNKRVQRIKGKGKNKIGF